MHHYQGAYVYALCIHDQGAYESNASVGETGVWLRADFQSGSRVLKKVF